MSKVIRVSDKLFAVLAKMAQGQVLLFSVEGRWTIDGGRVNGNVISTRALGGYSDTSALIERSAETSRGTEYELTMVGQRAVEGHYDV